MRWVRQAGTFARLLGHRTVRRYRDRPLYLALGLVAVIVGVSLLGQFGSVIGTALVEAAESDEIDATIAVRATVAGWWFTLAIMYTMRVLGEVGSIPEPEGVFTTIPTRAVALGLMLAEAGYLLVWLTVPALVLGGAMAVGAGAPLLAVTLPVAMLVTALAAMAVGMPAGLAIRFVSSRIRFVVRYKLVIILLAMVTYFGLIVTDRLIVAFEAVSGPLGASPVGWAGDLVLLGIGAVEASPVYAAGFLVVATVVVAAGLVAVTWIGDRYWLSDPVLITDERPTGEPAVTALPTLDRWVGRLGRSRAAFAVLTWRRAIRSPVKLLYAAYPLLFMGVPVATVVSGGQVPAYIPWLSLFAVVWMGGVLFTLNPLGEHGGVLPATVLASPDGRTFVLGHLLAAVLVTGPVAVLVTVPLAWLAGYGPLDLAAIALVTIPLVTAAALAALGIGVAFPKFEETSISRSMTGVIPSVVGFALYTTYLFAGLLAATVVVDPTAREVLVAIVDALIDVVTVPTWAVLAASLALLVLVLAVPVRAYGYVVSAYETYRVA